MGVKKGKNLQFENLAQNFGLECVKIGVVGGDEFKLNNIKISLNELKKIYFDGFAKMINEF